MSKKALIAMSGGVDSSVAAALMAEQGYTCVGVTMKLFDRAGLELDENNTCCSTSDIEDARAVAERLNMPFEVVDFMDRFQEVVMDNFVTCYENGITPNPCVVCNRYLKFDKLFQRGEELGCDYIVTGHYAQVVYNEATGRYNLLKGHDENKDQSYVLYSLTQEQLSHIILPLGGYSKPEVRALAEAHSFINAEKSESQDICFIPTGKYTDFIERYTGKHYPEGDFVDRNGKVLGTHKGIIRYTIGQRKGLGLALPQPMYVCEVDVENNKVVLGYNADLFSTTLIAKGLNLISCDHLEEPLRVTAKVRYKHKEAPATVYQLDADTIKVVFDEPQRAITKGQAVVLYDGDEVVGGATITETNVEE